MRLWQNIPVAAFHFRRKYLLPVRGLPPGRRRLFLRAPCRYAISAVAHGSIGSASKMLRRAAARAGHCRSTDPETSTNIPFARRRNLLKWPTFHQLWRLALTAQHLLAYVPRDGPRSSSWGKWRSHRQYHQAYWSNQTSSTLSPGPIFHLRSALGSL